MRKSTIRTAAVWLLIGVLSLVVAACGTGESGGGGGGDSGGESGEVKTGPGVDADAKTIKVGVLTALTGPIAVIGGPTEAAYKARFEAINAAGGIDGWKLEVVSRDTQYIPQNHVQAFNEVRRDIAILSSTGAPTTQAIQQQVDQEKLITQPISFDTAWGLDPVLAPLGTPYALEVMNAITYQVQENGAEGKKFGMLYQNDEFGKDGLRGFDAAVEELGVEGVAKVPYKSGDTDFTGQVQKLKSAGAEVVMCTCSAPSIAAAVGTAASQGYKPTWLAQSLAFTPQIMSEDGSKDGKKTPVAGALAENTFTSAFATPLSALPDAEGWDQLQADTNKYAPDQKTYLPYYVFGYAHAMVTEAILRKAIEDGDLSREGIYNAKIGIGTIDLQGISSDVTYQEEAGPPARGSAIAKVTLEEDGFLDVVEENYESDTAKNYDIEQAGQ